MIRHRVLQLGVSLAAGLCMARAQEPAPESRPGSAPASRVAASQVLPPTLAQARQQLSEGKAEVALRMAKRALAEAESAGSSLNAARVHVVAAACQRALHRPAEAMRAAESAVAAARAALGSEDHEVMAEALAVLAGCHADQAHAEAACEQALRAAAVLGRLAIPTIIAWDVADVLSRFGKFRDAVPVLETARTADDRSQRLTRLERSRILTLLAACLRWSERSEAALPHLAEAAEILEALPGSATNLGVVLTLHTACLFDLGRIAPALPIARRSYELCRTLKDAEKVAAAANNLASVHQALGQWQEALALFREALGAIRSVRPEVHSDVAATLNGLASCLYSWGRLPEALPYFEEAAAMYGAIARENVTVQYARTDAASTAAHEDLALVLQNLATCRLYLGCEDEALRLQRQSLEMYESVVGKVSAPAARSLGKLAEGLSLLGRDAEALDAAARAVDVWAALSPPREVDLAIAKGRVAQTKLRLGRPPADCLRDLDAALAVLRVSPAKDQRAVAEVLRPRAACLQRLGQVAAALDSYHEALGIARSLRHGPEIRVSADAVGRTLVELGLISDAVPYFAEAIDQIEVLRASARGLGVVDATAWFWTLSKYGSFTSMIKAQLALGRADEALRFLERMRARSLLDLLERAGDDPMEQAWKRAIDAGDLALGERIRSTSTQLRAAEERSSSLAYERAGLARRKDLDAGSASAEQARSERDAHAADAKYRELEHERARLVLEHVPLAQVKDAAAVRDMLLPGEVLLEYLIDPERSFLFVVRPSGKAIEAVPLGPLGPEFLRCVEECVAAFGGEAASRARSSAFAPGKRPGSRPASAPRPTTRQSEVFQRLIPAQVWKELLTATRVFVVPDGPLRVLPFDALVVSPGTAGAEPTRWLEVGPPVAYAASASALAWSRLRWERQRREGPACDLELVALGNPTLHLPPPGDSRPHRGEGLLGLEPLPGSEREVLGVAGLFGDRARALVGDEASEANLSALARRSRRLHLATHHVLDPVATRGLGALVLTGPAKLTLEDDGLLVLTDLLERWRGALAQCELVVLSACATQSGQRLKDDEQFALPWGFLYAGSPAVVASLWRVDDTSTAELMAEFYKRMKGGTGKLDALHAAKLELRKKYPDPYYWAPFVLLGDPR